MLGGSTNKIELKAKISRGEAHKIRGFSLKNFSTIFLDISLHIFIKNSTHSRISFARLNLFFCGWFRCKLSFGRSLQIKLALLDYLRCSYWGSAPAGWSAKGCVWICIDTITLPRKVEIVGMLCGCGFAGKGNVVVEEADIALALPCIYCTISSCFWVINFHCFVGCW